MSQKPLVSIIVPVYNAESYLLECLESICRQTYQVLEILVIIDGATDRSRDIAEEVAFRDGRMTVVVQENGGPSAARNRGLAMATGRYVQFVDADDTIFCGMTERLVTAMEYGVDLALCGFQMGCRFLRAHLVGMMPIAVFVREFGRLYADMLFPSPCNKMYRLDLIRKGRLRFMDGVAFGEDLLFNLAYVQACRMVFICDEALYRYQYNPRSLTNTYVPEMLETQERLYEAVRDFLLAMDGMTAENRERLGVLFAEGVLQGATNLYHPDSPYSRREAGRLLKDWMGSQYVNQFVPYYIASLQARVFRFLLRAKCWRIAAGFFQCKQWLRSFRWGYVLLQKVNKWR